MTDLLVSAFLNIEDFYRRMYWSVPGATTVHTDAYTLSYSSVVWLHSINQLWLHLPLATDDIQLRVAARFFRRYRAEYSIVFTEPLMPGVADWLEQHGYFERVSSPILALDGLPRIRLADQPARVIRAGIEHQQDLLSIMYDTFFIGPEIARCVVRPEHFEDSITRHYLAYAEGEPASCATILISNGIAGVWNVGTLRPYRRRGLASALLHHALSEAAADGYIASTLIASPMGRPLYEAMGYRWVGNVLYYGPGHEQV